MNIFRLMLLLAMHRPRWVLAGAAVLTLGLGALIPQLRIDTDPENMLPADQPTRVFHRQVKADFSLYDFLVVGLVEEERPEGVFNPSTLTHVQDLTRAIQQMEGVVTHEVLSLATVDDVRPDGPGTIRFEWLMGAAPTDQDQADAIRKATQRQPMLQGTLVSEDEQALAIYVPILDKGDSHRIADEIRHVAAEMGITEALYITGLPVAEETFGVEMFRQMGMAAPLAGIVVFFMLWVFFRSFVLITAPMLVALATVIATMGLMIGLGFPVHIMSSMIPIFLMPIAVVDAVHLLSEFADSYRHTGAVAASLRAVMHELFKPMLYTSLTSAVGFASLALAPIPPVRVFGLFVAFGILLAFLLTIMVIPAYITLMKGRHLTTLLHTSAQDEADATPLGRGLRRFGHVIVRYRSALVLGAGLLVGLGALGIGQIAINDNPVRWFRPNHTIRVADRVLNRHFGGTYDAYLVVQQDDTSSPEHGVLDAAAAFINRFGSEQDATIWTTLRQDAGTEPDVLLERVYDQLDAASTDREATLWEDVAMVLSGAPGSQGVFRQPEVLAYLEQMQTALLATEQVGKSNALPDLVKTVHHALREGKPSSFSIPASAEGVAQTLLSYQSSHRPNDLWHFVTPDYKQAVIWVQLKSGDNQDMLAVQQQLDAFLDVHPPPSGLTVAWAGLTSLNVVWQDEMVRGMLQALLGSFVIVFGMMLLLFRSLRLALLAMLPLTATIALIYGVIGWVGKDYDMPIAVLSSLTLGLSIDFAIHFLQRARILYTKTESWQVTMQDLFGAPTRAITRNALVVTIGFLPLLVSPLVPYNTVGLMLATIMVVSCLATLVLLPGLLRFGLRR